MKKWWGVGKRTWKMNAYFKITAICSAAFLALLWILPIWRILPLVEERQFLALHYNVFLGVDYIGPWYHIFLLPGIGLALYLVNFIFSVFFFEREKILSYFFATATLLVELTLLAAMVLIVLLNI